MCVWRADCGCVTMMVVSGLVERALQLGYVDCARIYVSSARTYGYGGMVEFGRCVPYMYILQNKRLSV